MVAQVGPAWPWGEFLYYDSFLPFSFFSSPCLCALSLSKSLSPSQSLARSLAGSVG
jgi:hypothetical protein